MSASTLISRFATYYERNGFTGTLQRIGVGIHRLFFSNRMVLMHCDLTKLDAREDLPASLTVERKNSQTEISQQDLDEILNFWNAQEARNEITTRFARKATLWMIKSDGKLAGYVWTMQGDSMVPHYFPLGPHDVHFFDLLIYPGFRGRAINWVLITHVLHELAAGGATRAFSEVKEWNRVSMASFTMTPFQIHGMCRKFVLFDHPIVWWDKKSTRP
ncbi:MAG TPA: GNAT family N-acetyltransferase [Candidatus Sulfotelmatobacter sp.]|nr:GNAT family N-acetyltransferase [Candidatus Sulfotelmatobacter sp.]